MKLEHQHAFEVSPAQLRDVLTSRRYFEARFAMSGIEDFWFDAWEETDRGLLIRVEREMEFRSSKIPAFARRFLGQRAVLSQEFLWVEREQLPYRAEYRFRLRDIPVTVYGEVQITEEQGHAGQLYRVEVDSQVPMVGRKLADLARDQVYRALESDYRGTCQYLRNEGLIR